MKRSDMVVWGFIKLSVLAVFFCLALFAAPFLSSAATYKNIADWDMMGGPSYSSGATTIDQSGNTYAIFIKCPSGNCWSEPICDDEGNCMRLPTGGDYVLKKFSPDGVLEYERNILGSNTNYNPREISIDNDGNIIVFYVYSDGDSTDARVRKYDASGVQTGDWTTGMTLGMSPGEYYLFLFTSFKIDSSSNSYIFTYKITGTSENPVMTSVLRKYGADGSFLSEINLGETLSYYSFILDIDSTGKFRAVDAILSYDPDTGNPVYTMIVKTFSHAGELLSSWTLDGSSSGAFVVAADPSGNVSYAPFICSNWESSVCTAGKVILRRYTSTGTFIGEFDILQLGEGWVFGVYPDTYGNIFIRYTTSADSTTGYSWPVNDMRMSRYSPMNVLSVSKTGTGTGTITSSPAGISCGATCSYDFESGQSVTLTAAPDANSHFTGWSGACTGTSFTCTVAMNDAASVVAGFDILTSGTKKISVSPSAVNFGTIKKGVAVARNITIKNTGTGELAVGTPAIGGANAAEFSVTTNCYVLAKNQTCVATINLNAASYGTKTATLTIPSNDPKKLTYNVNLKGKCAAPKISEMVKIFQTASGTF